MKVLLGTALAVALVGMACDAGAAPIVSLSGSDANVGDIDLSTPGSYTLWDLLGGSTTATTAMIAGGTLTTNGAITNFTPTGDNSKNAILRDYLVITNASGQNSVVSLGEIDPQFVGSATSSPVGASGNYVLQSNGATVTFEDLGAGASGRNLSDVTSITLLAAAAQPGPINPPPATNPITLAGNVSHPGSYTLPALEADFTPTTETVNGDTYTGVPLWDFLGANNSNVLGQYVIAVGSDGYEVVYSLAELDPLLGGNSGDLLPYADTNGNFPSSGLARTILPGDTPFAHGRWESNLDLVSVNEVPEPGSMTLFLSALALGAFAYRSRRYPSE